MTKYYLNNMSETSVSIKLTAKRTIKPYASLALNNKDVEIVKALKLERKGKPSIFDYVVLSTIKIEDDSRYADFLAKLSPAEAEKRLKTAEDKAKKEAEAEEQARKEAEEQARKEAEEQAKKEAEAAEQARLAKRAEVAELLKAEAAKEGKNISKKDLEKAIDIYLTELEGAEQ